nr:MAG TPA_asm: hypothetical protein [Bacteriophage sp.]
MVVLRLGSVSPLSPFLELGRIDCAIIVLRIMLPRLVIWLFCGLSRCRC